MLKHRTTSDSRSIDFEQDSCTPDWIQSLDRPVDEVAEHKADEPSVRFCLSVLSALRSNDGTVTRTKPEPNLNLRRKARVPRTTGVAEGDLSAAAACFIALGFKQMISSLLQAEAATVVVSDVTGVMTCMTR